MEILFWTNGWSIPLGNSSCLTAASDGSITHTLIPPLKTADLILGIIPGVGDAADDYIISGIVIDLYIDPVTRLMPENGLTKRRFGTDQPV